MTPSTHAKVIDYFQANHEKNRSMRVMSPGEEG
jgi:hypothetical protein